jgi:hypothetical protein
LRTMPILSPNFLTRYFHVSGWGGAEWSNDHHALRTSHIWILISIGMWSKSSTVFVFAPHSTLKQRTREAAASVRPDVRGLVRQEMEYRLYVRRATNGANTELR